MARHTLRQIIDAETLLAATPIPPTAGIQRKAKPKNGAMNATPPSGGRGAWDGYEPDNTEPDEQDPHADDDVEQETPASQVANKIARNIQDPLGSTRQGFQNLEKARQDYELAKHQTNLDLLPVKAIVHHVTQKHGLDGPDMGVLDPTQNPDQQDGYQQGQNGVPGNMNQQPGAMQMKQPKMAWQQPGAGPKVIPGGQPGNAGTAGQQQVRGPKLGMPSGGTGASNLPGFPGHGVYPAGGSPNNPKFSPAAAPPKGAGTMPKKPGSAGAKAKGKSSRDINVHINSAAHRRTPGASRRLETQLNFAALQASPKK